MLRIFFVVVSGLAGWPFRALADPTVPGRRLPSRAAQTSDPIIIVDGWVLRRSDVLGED